MKGHAPTAVEKPRRPALRAASFVALICVSLLSLYALVLHPWMMNWGSTAEEQSATLPGDQDFPAGTVFFTRAVTIKAPTSTVWAWLIQHGQDRAGFYSNDYLENLVGADIHNGNTLRPEWQDRAIGDKIPMARPDLLGGMVGDSLYVRIQDMEAERMLTTVDGNGLPARWFLIPGDGGTTRLLVRELPFGQAMGEAFAFWVWDPMHFVMEARMLRGIAERAEGNPLVPGWLALVARLGWIAAGLFVAAAFASRRRRIPVGVLCAVAVVPSFASAADLDSAVAGFLALGISFGGFIYLGRRWFLVFPLVAAGVLLTLLVAPDSWTAFGVVFLIGTSVAVYSQFRRSRPRLLVRSQGAPRLAV